MWEGVCVNNALITVVNVAVVSVPTHPGLVVSHPLIHSPAHSLTNNSLMTVVNVAVMSVPTHPGLVVSHPLIHSPAHSLTNNSLMTVVNVAVMSVPTHPGLVVSQPSFVPSLKTIRSGLGSNRRGTPGVSE